MLTKIYNMLIAGITTVVIVMLAIIVPIVGTILSLIGFFLFLLVGIFTALSESDDDSQ